MDSLGNASHIEQAVITILPDPVIGFPVEYIVRLLNIDGRYGDADIDSEAVAKAIIDATGGLKDDTDYKLTLNGNSIVTEVFVSRHESTFLCWRVCDADQPSIRGYEIRYQSP